MDKLNTVVAGHLCLDMFPSLNNLPSGQFMSLFRPGRLIKSGAMSFSTGGAVSNTGLALSKLGIPVKLIAKVGNDPFGTIIRNMIGQYDTQLVDGIVGDTQSETSYTIILNPPGVDRIFIHCPGANDTFDADIIDYKLVANAKLFHFGYPPLMRQMYLDNGKNLVEVLKRAKDTGVTTSLDLSFPDPSSESGKADWVTIFKNVMPQVDLFLPSFEELLFMLRREDFDKLTAAAVDGDIMGSITPELLAGLSSELIDMGAKVVGIKLGSRGFYLHTTTKSYLKSIGSAKHLDLDSWSDKEIWTSCFKVNLVGAAGAGDSTIAGFLGGFLRGLSPEEASNMAVAVGACNVEAADTLSGVRSWEDTVLRISEGWQKHPLAITNKGWDFDQHHNLWKK